MIEKFISIKNIGRFSDCCPRGDVTFRKLTLLFAENGRGKSTLCAILRSLQTGQHEFISERKTLGTTNPASVQIRIGGNTATFGNNAWTVGHPDIAIFDSVFVHDNVYAGDYVDHEHKKNLYRVIVGDQWVQLSRQIEDLDGKIREANRDINTKKDTVLRTIPNGTTLETYLAWQPVEDIDTKIQQKNTEIATRQRTLEKATEIHSKGLLTKIVLPEFPSDFLTILSKQLADITADAETRVRRQINAHSMGNQGETWLSQGLGFVAGDKCPFCGQGINGNELIAVYRSHFNVAYKELKQVVAQVSQRVTNAIGESSLNAPQQKLSSNLTLVEFWKQFAEIAVPDFAFNDVHIKYAMLREHALALAQRKQQAPAESILPDADFQSALDAVTALQQSFQSYNAAVDACNALINERKTAAQQGGGINALKREHADLEAKKKRLEPAVVQACKEYQDALTAKTNLEQQKTQKKDQLDQDCEQILQTYEKAINLYLGQFNAGFRIVNTKHDYRGGTPRSLFQIQINNTPIDVGDSQTSGGKPCFKTTLSSGDRSALALAFFLAALKQDLGKGNKVVVFDDPFTSLDRFRRECTAQLLISFANEAKQTIVLSHDPTFLKLCQDNAGSVPLKELQVLKTGQGSVIAEWNATEATKGAYLKNHSILLRFYRERTGDLQLVAQAIRPFLEELYRTHFPSCFPPNEWLGDFIGKVKAAQDDEGLAHVKTDIQNIEAINEYSKKFHHGNAPNIDSDELHGFVKRTLSLTGGS